MTDSISPSPCGREAQKSNPASHLRMNFSLDGRRFRMLQLKLACPGGTEEYIFVKLILQGVSWDELWLPMLGLKRRRISTEPQRQRVHGNDSDSRTAQLHQ